jgi:hypothetical protein
MMLPIAILSMQEKDQNGQFLKLIYIFDVCLAISLSDVISK